VASPLLLSALGENSQDEQVLASENTSIMLFSQNASKLFLFPNVDI
jgi:hypothetical protein